MGRVSRLINYKELLISEFTKLNYISIVLLKKVVQEREADIYNICYRHK